jgi:endonuclease-3
MTRQKIAKQTAKVVTTISKGDFVPRRQTRAFAASLQAFAYEGDGGSTKGVKRETVKQEDLSDDGSSALSSVSSGSAFDIEDLPFGTSSSSRKRKRGVDSPATAVTTISTATSASTRVSPRKAGSKSEDGTIAKAKKARRQPAKRVVNEAGEEEIQPPTNWEEIYDAVREMRKAKLAPVDTMGCETLAEEHLTPRVGFSPSPLP